MSVQKDVLSKVSTHLEAASEKLVTLEAALKKAQGLGESLAKAEAYRDKVLPAMNAMRSDVDALEATLPSDVWPVPTYAEMLFNL